MAFVVGPTDRDKQSEFADFLLQQQKQLTELQGRNGAVVFVVADYLLDELRNLSLPSRPLSESELTHALSPGGLRYHRLLKATTPELLSFDGRLPAPGMKTATLYFQEWHITDVLEILRHRTDQKLSFHRCFGINKNISESLLKVVVDLPTTECDAIGQELCDRGVIGVSPLTRLLLGRDPDR